MDPQPQNPNNQNNQSGTQQATADNPNVANQAAAVTTPTNLSQPLLPPEVKQWSWGGFLLTWIWGIGNHVWIALLVLPFYIFTVFRLPFFYLGSLIFSIYLGVKGKELAWKAKSWPSIEGFQKTQRQWTIWGIIIGAILPVLALIAIILVIATERAVKLKGG